jgi:hypothetical protein
VFERPYDLLVVFDPTRSVNNPSTMSTTSLDWMIKEIDNADRYLNDPNLEGFIFEQVNTKDVRPGHKRVWIHEKVQFVVRSLLSISYIHKVRMSMRWIKSPRLVVHYMCWSRFRDLVCHSTQDDLIREELCQYDFIWGGADLMLNLRCVWPAEHVEPPLTI